MASDQQVVDSDLCSPLQNPWPLVLVGLSLAVVAFFLTGEMADATVSTNHEWAFPRVALVIVGLLAAAGGVWIKPRHPGVLGLAAAVGLVSYMAMDNAWDSAKMVVAILTVLSAFSALVMALPLVIGPEAGRVVGRALVSLFIVYHFGGILVAVTSVPTPGGTVPWVPATLWTYLYRPYLQFMYLNNAYHFYSPEPGPPSLIWARVEYSDKSSRWVSIPNRDEHFKDPLGQQYYRRLSLTESINQLERPAATFTNEDVQIRVLNGRDYKAGPIPMHPIIPINLQHRPPKAESRKMLSCVARYIAENYKHPTQPDLEVTSIKIYRVVHQMLQPSDLVRYDPKGNRVNRIQFSDKDGKKTEDVTPLLPTLYQPFFQGEYNRDGKLLDERDTLLYWLIPIVPVFSTKMPEPFQNPFRPQVQERPVLVDWIDYLTIHAGSNPWEEVLK